MLESLEATPTKHLLLASGPLRLCGDIPLGALLDRWIFGKWRRWNPKCRVCRLFQQTGTCGKRRPQQCAFPPAFTKQECQRCRHPHAEAIKAVQQLSPETVTRCHAQVNHDIPRPIFCLKQVRDPPNRKQGENKSINFRILVHNELMRHYSANASKLFVIQSGWTSIGLRVSAYRMFAIREASYRDPQSGNTVR